MKKAFFIGRFTPPHKGHIEAILKLVNEFDEVVIGLGSCYEVGNPRHPFLAIHREKMLLLSLFMEACDLKKIKFAHIQDFKNFEDWIDHISLLIKKENITHFVTGNQEDILNVLKEKGINLNLEFINPEVTSSVPFHASDLRQAILDGDYDKFLEIAAPGTIALMGNVNGFQGIRDAIEDTAPRFYYGRQTVDVVVTLSEKIWTTKGSDEKKHFYYKDYVLCGKRPSDPERDFANYLGLLGGAIDTFESPLDAALRALKEKAGIETIILDRKLEPAHISIKTPQGNIITTLEFLKLYNSDNITLAGSKGGSSQCYHIALQGNPNNFMQIKDTPELRDIAFRSIEDVIKEGLAYEQTSMVESVYKKLGR